MLRDGIEVIEVISIHAPRMGSDLERALAEPDPEISIHAPRMGSDTAWYPTYAQIIVFQSTLPGWGATIP